METHCTILRGVASSGLMAFKRLTDREGGLSIVWSSYWAPFWPQLSSQGDLRSPVPFISTLLLSNFPL